MDEILVANFMVFDEIADAEHYDLWVGDEAWELDHFLHENPELKTTAFAWMTDFVGWLPMADGAGGRAHRRLQRRDARARRPAAPRARPRDVRGQPARRRPGVVRARACPTSADWTAAHYDFAGYVTGFDPAEIADRTALREPSSGSATSRCAWSRSAAAGWAAHLLRRAVEAAPLLRERRPRHADGRRHRAADRPGVAAGAAGRRGARLAARPAPAARRRPTSRWCRAA